MFICIFTAFSQWFVNLSCVCCHVLLIFLMVPFLLPSLLSWWNSIDVFWVYSQSTSSGFQGYCSHYLPFRIYCSSLFHDDTVSVYSVNCPVSLSFLIPTHLFYGSCSVWLITVTGNLPSMFPLSLDLQMTKPSLLETLLQVGFKESDSSWSK